MANINISSETTVRGKNQIKGYIWPFILLCILFFLWAVANNLNDILLPQFQQAFTLSNFQAGLIQSSFYFGYFIIPLPAGILMKKTNYKTGIIFGLILYAIGAAFFFPAAQMMNYALFLIGLFIIAAGAGCLETAANPFVTLLGPEDKAHYRINLAQTFNSFGSIIAVIFGQSLILAHVPHKSTQMIAHMTSHALFDYHYNLVQAVKMPYVIIGVCVIIVAILIFTARFPAIAIEQKSANDKNESLLHSLPRLFRIRHWRWAVLAQFCYVGAQTACWSYLIRYALDVIPHTTASYAANYLTATMVLFFIGRFSGTWLIKRYAPHKILTLYAVIAMILCFIAAGFGGYVGLIALTLVSLFMSIQYPTIFSLGIDGLGKDTKYGSSIIVMMIIGGGVVTPIMGFVSDLAGHVETAEIIPAICFLVIAVFAGFRAKNKQRIH